MIYGKLTLKSIEKRWRNKVKTKLTIHGDKFLINNKLTYSEYENCPEDRKGLLMNARFIQGVFNDTMDISRFQRFGRIFDPENNTDQLIQSLPAWYASGIRAITVGFQGGGPCFTIQNQTICNNPYSEDGSKIDGFYLNRMERIIKACDELGIIVIVSLFYGAQTRFLKDDRAIIEAVKSASNWLRDLKVTNVIIEIANEHDIQSFAIHPILYNEQGVKFLIELAKRESDGLPIGCSGSGGYYSDIIANASDVILLHGNAQSRQRLYNLIQKAKKVKPARPIVINEDSQALSQLQVCFDTNVSWGYYNNMTKQEPPVDWSITRGEDEFFAQRLSVELGIRECSLKKEDRFYLQGLEKDSTYEGKRWIRLASMYPEQIDKVIFYRNGQVYSHCYVDPFTVHFQSNWIQGAVMDCNYKEVWKACIYLKDGTTIWKEGMIE